jgi:hypothetical protein
MTAENDHSVKLARGCSTCAEVEERCADCAAHLADELTPTLFLHDSEGRRNLVFLHMDAYWEAVRRGGPRPLHEAPAR